MNRDSLRLTDRAACQLGRKGEPVVQAFSNQDLAALLTMRGNFRVSHRRDGRLLEEWSIPNTIVNEGKNHILNVQFHGTSAIGTWYLGLIDNSGFTAITAADTYANINQPGNGWDEFDDYTDRNNSDNSGTRPAWPENAASGQAITNSTLAIYDFTASGTLKGLFVAGGTNGQTKNDHTGSGNILWAATAFASNVSVDNGDDLSVTYSVSW